MSPKLPTFCLYSPCLLLSSSLSHPISLFSSPHIIILLSLFLPGCLTYSLLLPWLQLPSLPCLNGIRSSFLNSPTPASQPVQFAWPLALFPIIEAEACLSPPLYLPSQQLCWLLASLFPAAEAAAHLPFVFLPRSISLVALAEAYTITDAYSAVHPPPGLPPG